MAALNCPVPLSHKDKIVLGHGSGGRLTHELISNLFRPIFDSPELIASNDFAALSGQQGDLIVSTDSHVVNPIFFPGGDIGRLAVCGTVNDVAVSGAIPRYITAGFIIEEGFSIADLQKIIISMKVAADEAGVSIIAGDTKVVEKSKADGLFITTTGIGWLPYGLKIDGSMAKGGDAVIISGTIAEHGIAVMAARGDMGIQTEIRSDVAPLSNMIHSLVETCPGVHVMRDPTRGGLATTLKEISLQSKVTIIIDENKIPIMDPVKNACELFGFDPLFVANEGKIVIILPESEVASALEALRKNKYGTEATLIGMVRAEQRPQLLMKTSIGGTRVLEMLAGEILPRIC